MRVFTIAFATVGLSTGSLAAQNASCPSEPGTQFGIVTLECAQCTVTRDARGGVSYLFGSPPIVRATAPGSELRNADVIEAVDSLPITSRPGSERLVSPGRGAHTLSVRRGNALHVVLVEVGMCLASAKEPGRPSKGNDGIHLGSGSGSGKGIGEAVLGGANLVVTRVTSVTPHATIQGAPVAVVEGSGRNPAVGRFGFATSCRPSCSALRMPDGNYVLKYDGYPVVAVVRNGSAADRAGLRVGDEILSVNGRSILSDGALAGISAGDELDLTLLRESREINLHLRSN
jgi:hypothetical protein